MRTDIITIVPTFHKRLKYIPFVEKALQLYFNINAHRVYISDAPIKSLPDLQTWVSKKEQWAEIILEGMLEFEKQYQFQYVFLLLEDLFPFEKVPANVIEDHLAVMKKNNLKSVVFSTYPREWQEASFSSAIIDAMSFYDIPGSFKFYSQLQPGIWDKNYLKSILYSLIAEKKFTPWDFEFYKSEERHLMAKYQWPNVLGGFIESGEVNREVLEKIKGNKDLKAFRSLLRTEYYKAKPGLLFKRIFKFKK